MSPGCNKKLKEEGGSLICTKCQKPYTKGTVKYKVVIIALDKSGDVPLLLWDREVAELVRIPASLLYQKYKEVDVEVPLELDAIVGMKILFKIGFKQALKRGINSPFNVLRLVREDLLKTYSDRFVEHQEQDLMSRMLEEETNTHENSEEASIGEEVNSPASVQPSQKDVDDVVNSVTTKRSLLDGVSSSKSENLENSSSTNNDAQGTEQSTASCSAQDKVVMRQPLHKATTEEDHVVNRDLLSAFEEKSIPLLIEIANNGKTDLGLTIEDGRRHSDIATSSGFAYGVGEQDDIHVEIVNVIQRELDNNNVLVKSFRMAMSELNSNPCAEVKIKLLGKRTKDARTYNLSQVSEVAALIVGDLDTSIGERHIVVQTKGGKLQRISELNPSYLPLQYPLLFPYGEDGYREDIAFLNVLGNRSSGGRHRISPREFFCYRIQSRNSVQSTILFAKRLFQQFVVDGYTMVESGRLIYIRTHQKSLRCETYSGLIDALTRGEVDPAAQGRRIILPSSFTSRARYMIQNYQDAMAISDCRKNKLFGSVAGVIYTIEFQKRCLPHAHILLFLEKTKEVSQVVTLDKIISAEIPDENTDVEYYKSVEEFMMHGPCGKSKEQFSIRGDNGRIVTKNGIALDNRYVVPHNRHLLLKYEAHINVEWRNQSRLIKYVNKGHDRVTTEFYKTRNYEENGKVIDGINMYYDYDDPVENTVNRPTIAQSMFLEWFEANKTFPDARELTYVEMPTRFVWKKDLIKWQPRKKGFSIGRIFYVPPATREIFYLRCLLNKIRGPTSYADIRTVNGVHYASFRDACYARGLVDDDNEYVDAIDEASHWASRDQLRRLFVTLLMSSCMGKPETVWNDAWPQLSDDAQFQIRKQLKNRDFVLTDSQKMNFALVEIEKLLSIHGLYKKNCHITVWIRRKDNQELVSQLTEEQKVIYNEVLTDIDRKAGGLFFVYGYGGTGKTFLWRALSSAFRSKREIVLNVASSGIASLLLPGGRTAHSRFAIPISVNEDSTCNISDGSPLAELIFQRKLIIWDEAPMMHKFCFEALDRTMRDLLCFKNPSSYEMTFGGKTVVFGVVFRLTKNLRLRSVQSQIEGKEIEEFANWLANIGDETVGNSSDGESDITIPEHLLLKCEDDPIATIVDSTFPHFRLGIGDLSYLNDSAILAPTLDVVDNINQYMNYHNPAEGKTYLSCDSVCKSDSNVDMLADSHTPKFLNELRCSGVPNHALTLKVGSPVMLLRNIDLTLKLCNGTRLIVTRI
ncbi:PREDICTED: uncharacterized protein LOC109178476 [Ipomoea nil]|uniref:uncharacterized protein LOC109178476 n=1 Tax=Ipomoea nil TaxID=35883 RepID=UPI000901E391|nr:PREDICTED: uncharacterized protein LOC109178476 [Ipomoea nil]